jgi:hypothetical protein
VLDHTATVRSEQATATSEESDVVRPSPNAKRALAIALLASIIVLVTLVAPPVAAIAIAFVALPLSALIVASLSSGSDRSLPQA